MWFLFGKVLHKFPSKDWMDFHKGIMWKNNEEIPFQFFKANNGAWNIHQWLFFFAAISQLNAIIIIALWLHYAKRVHAAINDANASTPVKIVTIAEPKQTNLIYSPHSGCKSQISRWWFWQLSVLSTSFLSRKFASFALDRTWHGRHSTHGVNHLLEQNANQVAVRWRK